MMQRDGSGSKAARVSPARQHSPRRLEAATARGEPGADAPARTTH
ncbi:hypothetical protein [Streptomyces sp. CC224B]|nr:hypothetical protein [Streptomyces sp. CC224B]